MLSVHEPVQEVSKTLPRRLLYNAALAAEFCEAHGLGVDDCVALQASADGRAWLECNTPEILAASRVQRPAVSKFGLAASWQYPRSSSR